MHSVNFYCHTLSLFVICIYLYIIIIYHCSFALPIQIDQLLLYLYIAAPIDDQTGGNTTQPLFALGTTPHFTA